MIKLIGCALIFFSMCGTGYAASCASRREITEAEALLQFVRYICARISYFKEPLPDIYSDFKNDTLSSCGFLNILIETGWEKALGCVSVGNDIKEISLNLARSLGKSSADEQVRECEYCISLLENNLDALKAAYPAKKKVYQSLGVTAGLMSVIIII